MKWYMYNDDDSSYCNHHLLSSSVVGQSYCFFLNTEEHEWVVLIRQIIPGNEEWVNSMSLKSSLFATRHFWTNIMKPYPEAACNFPWEHYYNLILKMWIECHYVPGIVPGAGEVEGRIRGCFSTPCPPLISRFTVKWEEQAVQKLVTWIQLGIWPVGSRAKG